MLYDVVLTGFDADEIMIIDLCMTMCDVDASIAYKMVDNMPSLLAHSVGMKEAKKIKKAFEYEGAYIDIREADDNSIEGIFKGLDAPGVDDKEDEGINLEKVFEDNSNINMKPNDYGDYALDNFSEKSEDDIDDVFKDSRYQNVNFFETVANQEEDSEEGFEFENEKPAYDNHKKDKSKQYITKQDLKDIDNNAGVNASPYASLMEEIEEEPLKGHGKKKKKKYITREIANDEESLSQLRDELFDTGYDDGMMVSQQEIIANNDFVNLGGNAYNEDCMQINTQKTIDNNMDSSIDNMKKLYDKKANRGNSKGKSLDEDWANVIKKHNSEKEVVKNTNDFRKEQVLCPKCGSTFVSAKKSQGFFGTKKVKYVCEACKFKF